jgi:hypothetical protein
MTVTVSLGTCTPVPSVPVACEEVQDCVATALTPTGLVTYNDAGNSFSAGGTAGQVPISNGNGTVTWNGMCALIETNASLEGAGTAADPLRVNTATGDENTSNLAIVAGAGGIGVPTGRTGAQYAALATANGWTCNQPVASVGGVPVVAPDHTSVFVTNFGVLGQSLTGAVATSSSQVTVNNTSCRPMTGSVDHTFYRYLADLSGGVIQLATGGGFSQVDNGNGVLTNVTAGPATFAAPSGTGPATPGPRTGIEASRHYAFDANIAPGASKTFRSFGQANAPYVFPAGNNTDNQAHVSTSVHATTI